MPKIVRFPLQSRAKRSAADSGQAKDALEIAERPLAAGHGCSASGKCIGEGGLAKSRGHEDVRRRGEHKIRLALCH